MNERDPRVELLPPEKNPGPGLPGLHERNWAMACHLAALFGYAFPFGHILGPLGVWMLKGERYPLVNDQGREALNFQLSVTIYFIAGGILIFAMVGIPLLVLLTLFHLIVIVVASVRSRSGERYRYPLTIRFIR